MIMNMIKIQGRDTALSLLVNPYILRHRIPQLYQLSSKKKTIHLALHCQLCSTCYTAVRINNCLKRTSTIKIAAMKIMDDFHYEWKPSRAYHKIDTFCGE